MWPTSSTRSSSTGATRPGGFTSQSRPTRWSTSGLTLGCSAPTWGTPPPESSSGRSSHTRRRSSRSAGTWRPTGWPTWLPPAGWPSAGGSGVVRFTGLTGLASGHEAAAVGGSGEPVECIPLAAILDGVETVDLLKVDTEGAEVDILEPAPTDLRDQVARVVVEYHDLAKRDRVLQALEARGYRCQVEPTRGFEHHLGLVYGIRR